MIKKTRIPVPAGISRRRLLQAGSAMALGSFLPLSVPVSSATGVSNKLITRPIPASGESIPIIGMGSWLTFDVGFNQHARAGRVKVLEAFFERGGGMIDSSPMYGSSPQVIGYCLQQIANQPNLFSASKVWIVGKEPGQQQIRSSLQKWQLPRFDLVQIHNLLDWETHLETLQQAKAAGQIRYIGVTTSHGRRHQELQQVLRTGEFDFVQFTYNILDREAENELLPLAQELGVAVIINRPFQRGALFDRVQGKPLPAIAAEAGCQNWAQYFLKFIVSHPAVTCAIPATSQVAHMHENMGAAYGALPDPAMRKRMAREFGRLI